MHLINSAVAGGRVVKDLAFHWCDPGSIPGGGKLFEKNKVDTYYRLSKCAAEIM